MKPIKISRENRDAIEAALQAVNGRATSMTMRHFHHVADVAERAETMLETLPKAERKGAVVTYVPEGPRANRYKYSAISTRLMLQRKASAWYLTDASRVDIWPKQPDRMAVYISPEQGAEISRRALAGFHVVGAG